MRIEIKTLLLLLLFMALPLNASEIESSYLDMRSSSGIVYYEELAAPFTKVLRLRDGILKQGPNFLRMQFTPDPASPDVLKLAQKTYEVADMAEALKIGDRLLQTLLHSNGATDRELVSAPLELLVRPLGMVGDITYDFQVSESKYKENPSSYLALVYLELALIHQKSGGMEKALELLTDASKTLQLEALKFPQDAKLRTTLPRELNFGRPESAILYLRAQIALKNSKPEEAARIAEILISNNPSDPYAWQALLEFGQLGGSEDELIKRILETYPCVMGYCDFELKSVSKDEFSVLLPDWIALARKNDNIENAKLIDKQRKEKTSIEQRNLEVKSGVSHPSGNANSKSIDTEVKSQSLSKLISLLLGVLALSGVVALIVRSCMRRRRYRNSLSVSEPPNRRL